MSKLLPHDLMNKNGILTQKTLIFTKCSDCGKEWLRAMLIITESGTTENRRRKQTGGQAKYDVPGSEIDAAPSFFMEQDTAAQDAVSHASSGNDLADPLFL